MIILLTYNFVSIILQTKNIDLMILPITVSFTNKGLNIEFEYSAVLIAGSRLIIRVGCAM